jgi:hypothetical protein
MEVCLRARRSFPGILPSLGLAAAVLVAAVLALLSSAGVAPAAADSRPAPEVPATASPSGSPAVPTWRLKSYRKVGFDRSFKADLIDELPEPPRLVIFGGSRATRFEPPYFLEQAGLPTFNCSVQNCRPTDAYAFASYLFSRAPDVKLNCVFAVQTATFADAALPPGLLYDERLAAAFPGDLIERQKALAGRPRIKEVLGRNRFTARGELVRNSYDIRRGVPGYSFGRHLDTYIRRLLPKYTWTGPARESRSRYYFEETMRLFNAHGVVPAVVIMPYHPRALRAFRDVGFRKKMAVLHAYLRDARTRCDFRVLNLLTVASFRGRTGWFYDGAHVTAENSRLIARHALRTQPDCFR